MFKNKKINNRLVLQKIRRTKKIKNFIIFKKKLDEKNQLIRDIKNNLIFIEQQNQAYKLLILNTCLSFGVIVLIYFNFYKLALIGCGYLLIKNNSIMQKKKEEYLSHKNSFNKSYKNLFPTLYYVLPIIGGSSGLGVFYTAHLLNDIYQEIFLERIHYLSCKPEIDFLLWENSIFFIIFIFYIFIDFIITLYVLQKTNSPFVKGWKHFLW